MFLAVTEESIRMRASSLLAVALVSLALAQPYVAPREEDSKKQQFAKLIEEIQADVLKSLDEREETMRKRASKPPAIQGTSSSAVGSESLPPSFA